MLYGSEDNSEGTYSRIFLASVRYLRSTFLITFDTLKTGLLFAYPKYIILMRPLLEMKYSIEEATDILSINIIRLETKIGVLPKLGIAPI